MHGVQGVQQTTIKMVDGRTRTGFLLAAMLMQWRHHLARRIGHGTLVVYETTLPVGTTRNRFGPALAEGSGLTLDEDLFLAFSPERVLVGRVFLDLQRSITTVEASDDGWTWQDPPNWPCGGCGPRAFRSFCNDGYYRVGAAAYAPSICETNLCV